MGEEILQGSLWLYRPAVLTELQTTAVSLGGEGCLVRGRSVELFCLRWQEHYPSISSQENHKWTHLVLSGKGCSWRLLGCHTISWWLFHPDVWGFFWCFFFFWVHWEVGLEGKEEGEIRGMLAWERSFLMNILSVSTELKFILGDTRNEIFYVDIVQDWSLLFRHEGQ